MFLPGRIKLGLSEQAYLFQMDALYKKSMNGRRVEHHVCRKEFVTGSLVGHLTIQQGVYHAYGRMMRSRKTAPRCPPSLQCDSPPLPGNG